MQRNLAIIGSLREKSERDFVCGLHRDVALVEQWFEQCLDFNCFVHDFSFRHQTVRWNEVLGAVDT
jgi:hypothetical protein